MRPGIREQEGRPQEARKAKKTGGGELIVETGAKVTSVALQSGLNDTQTEAKNVILLPLSSSSSAEKNIARSVGADYFVSGAVFLVEDVYGGTIVLEDFKRGDRYEIVRIAQSYALLIDELKEALQILGNVL